jgi:hypothetical protein
MKKNITQYILFATVIFIWGYVLFKIYKSLNAKDEFVNRKEIQRDTTNEYSETDSFTIAKFYPNPFIEVIGDELGQGNYEEQNNEEDNYIASIPLKWPKIEFMGIISAKKKTEKKTILLRIDNADYLVKNSEEIKQIKILAVYRDSVMLQFKNEKKTLKKNE